MAHEDVTLHRVERSIWWGWGDPGEAKPLPESARKHLRDRLGALHGTPPVALSGIAMPEVILGAGALEALRVAVGSAHVHIDPRSRMEHAGGKSYVDLARARDGDARKAPDAVVAPGSEDDVVAVLGAAAEHGFVVIPFGGGTSVVAGLSPNDDAAHRTRPVVSLDLRRLSGLVSLDDVSGTATFRAGTRAVDAERALREHGWTLGHFPQSYQQATIGGFVATRSAGQSSSGYGRIDDLVRAVRAVTPTGTLALGHRSPATAAGPRLLDVIVGSEGALAVITEVTLDVQRVRPHKQHLAVAFPSFEAGADALREMTQLLGHDGQPDVTRVSDPDETEVSLMLAGTSGTALSTYLRRRSLTTPCLGIFLWEDHDDAADTRRRKAAWKIMSAHGAVRLPAKVARSWEHGRFSAPYLRDELMTAGVFVETLETATTWTNLHNLHSQVAEAIHEALSQTETPGIVQCHISHVYHSGASLYFTYIAAEHDDRLAQWQHVKTAACQRITSAGGTITHHHAVGRDHQPYLNDEIGQVGTRILKAIKHELDPDNVLNPGALIDDAANNAAADAQ